MSPARSANDAAFPPAQRECTAEPGPAAVNLHAKLLEREAAGKPVTVGVIGAGKFGTMFLSQARLPTGMHVVGVPDLDGSRARSQLHSAGWPAELYAAMSLDDAHKPRAT